jgi:hypothetical protein
MASNAEKVAKFREMAKDKSLPQDVRNTYLDRANELERAEYEATKPKEKAAPTTAMAKGGAVVTKAPVKKAAKAPAKGAKPVVAIMVGMAKPKGKTMMNKGGMAKKGKC